MGKITDIIIPLVTDILNLRSDLDKNKIKDTEFAGRFYERIEKAVKEIAELINEKQIIKNESE